MKISDYLNQQDLSITQFAKLANIPHVTCWRICTGRQSPKIKDIEKINKATNGSVSYPDWVESIISHLE